MDFDAVIIGSGAGGGPLARALSEGGMRVLVLEKGRAHARREYVHDEIGIVRRDFFVPSIEEDPHTLMRAGDAGAERTQLGWVASCVGGGTVHMAGHFYRHHPDDFQMGRLFGLANWPFTYEDLEPYYARAEQEIGVSGLAGANPFEGPRSAPYPLPPVDAHPMAAWVDEACARLGLHAFPEGRSILSRPYGGRAACLYCDFCGSYGCEVGAKSSTQETMFAGCEVRAESMVREVTVGRAGRATGCVYIDAAGREDRVAAKIVCISASAVESARLLLLSNSPRFPNGLANGSGLVGRNLQFSSFSSGSGVFRLGRRERDDVLRARHPFLGRSLQDFLAIPAGVSDLPRGGTIRFAIPHANPIFTALKLAHETEPPRWGMALKDRMREYWHETRTIEFEVFGDFLPTEGTYVDLDPDVRDRWGLPAARIHLDAHPHHAKAGRYVVERGLEVLEAMGADEVRAGAIGAVTGHLVHGTCRAGTDPATSVLDPWCRAHEVPNLYVVDGSFMPTAGAVPTTLTILANSFRVADRILAAR